MNIKTENERKIIYVDNNATTSVAPEVFEAMVPFFKSEYFNPSSVYNEALFAHNSVEKSREKIAHLLGDVDPSEITFTSCATESNNMAIFGAIRANSNVNRSQSSQPHIITTAVEHPAVIQVCREAERYGAKVTFLSVNKNGELDITEFVRALNVDTLMVSIMHANNETGVIFPIEELSRITKETNPNIIFHTDATQTVGKLKIDLNSRSGNFRYVDLLSFSGHKLHAPKGVGSLFIRKGTAIRPILIGGHQERGKRAGTENVAGIVALAKAMELSLESGSENGSGSAGASGGPAYKELLYLKNLRDTLESSIISKVPFLEVNGAKAKRLPNTTNLSCHYIEGEGILYQLNSYGICASSGSACTSGSLDPSHVLKAMKIPFTAVHGSIRFSLSRYNTMEEINYISKVFPEIVRNLRRLSPYWNQEKDCPREGAPAV
ncbi:MAG: aminotransferase class V-fold PLP-dependent enzyme [Oligoflexia bacterium]|nr:aminotransferase class V-fold PLP-dependent enzyme [Oligoflexia bacterium]